jgi:hypothetical protein
MLKGNITMSRPQRNDDVRRVVIGLKDQKSGIRFVEVSIDLENFTEALMGLAEVEVDFEVKGLEHIGKVKETEAATVIVPFESYDKEKLRSWIEANAQRDSWYVRTYLGSQGSIRSTGDGNTFCRISYYRYVEEAV